MPAPKKSMRPKARPDDAEAIMALRRAERAAEREASEAESLMKRADGVSKMREGGMCRGMGAATRGGRFMKDG